LDEHALRDLGNLIEYGEVGQRVMGALRLALRAPRIDPRMHQPGAEHAGNPLTTRFATILPQLDRMTGGGYGVTVVSGAPKTGKSFFAIGSAIEAAFHGHRVVYLSCEMPIEQVEARFGRYFAAFPSRDRSDRLLAVIDVVHALHADQLVKVLEESVPAWSQERVLLVIDSVNSLVRQLGEDDQLQRIERVLMFLIRARRLAPGLFSALAICELNQHGHTKGRSAEYLADLVLRLRQCEKGMHGVEMDVQLSRESQSGLLGRFLLDPARGCFLPTVYEEETDNSET
jgi:KaiC/GvpD/RAD55 family RecA-like ATPase